MWLERDIDALRDRAMDEVHGSWVLSLPVPLSGRLHGFFACRASRARGVAWQPGACFAVREDDDAVLVFDHEAVFSGLYRPGAPVPLGSIPRVGREQRHLWSGYRAAAGEVFSNHIGTGATRYARKVLDLSPPELTPFYRALAPGLFSAAWRSERFEISQI